MVTTEERDHQNLRGEVAAFIGKLPEALRDDPVAKHLREFAFPAHIDLVHLIYRPDHLQGPQKDYQFDRGSCERRKKNGFADAEAAVAAAPWRCLGLADRGMRTFDIAAQTQS